MTPFPDPDRPARRRLARHRTVASALVVAMAGLTLATYAMAPGFWTELLQAAAKAGFVGGIADWFAVTALFRHPLGLPIPHTAIIAREQGRLGRALGRFVADHVFTEADVKSAHRCVTQSDFTIRGQMNSAVQIQLLLCVRLRSSFLAVSC